MMPTMEEIDDAEKAQEWLWRGEKCVTLKASVRDLLCAAARRGVEADAEACEERTCKKCLQVEGE